MHSTNIAQYPSIGIVSQRRFFVNSNIFQMRPLSIELLIGGGGRGSKLSTIRNGRPASSHRAAFSGPVFRGCALRFAPCARHSSPSGLRCAQSALAALPASLESSYRPALRWPGIPGLRSASRCPRPSTPSGLRRLRPVSRTARALRAPQIFFHPLDKYIAVRYNQCVAVRYIALKGVRTR